MGALYTCVPQLYFSHLRSVRLSFCECLVNNTQCCVSKPPLGSFYGSFLLEEDMSLLRAVHVVAFFSIKTPNCP